MGEIPPIGGLKGGVKEAMMADDSFVALDVRTLSSLSLLSEKNSIHSPKHHTLQNSLSRKGSHRFRSSDDKAAGGETAVTAPPSPSPGDEEVMKYATLVQVEGEERAGMNGQSANGVSSPATGGVRWRRTGRRSSPWLDPRRVVIFFATLSSMGTLILLYFTFSMGNKMGDGVANDQ